MSIDSWGACALAAGLSAFTGCVSDGGSSNDHGGTETHASTGAPVDPTSEPTVDSDIATESTTSEPTTTGSAPSSGADEGSTETGDAPSSSGASSGGCTPITCADMGFDCGTIFDGCGGTEECGSCREPATCGTFEENVCGCEETEWVTEHVAFMGDVGSDVSMGVDSQGALHIAYYNGAPVHQLWYATRPADGGPWTNEVIDGTFLAGRVTAMAIDADDGVHLSYYASQARNLHYAYKPAGESWTVELAATGNVGLGSDIAVDSNGVVHISHMGLNRVPRYTFGSLGAWTTESAMATPVGFNGGTEDTSIAIDETDGSVHMCMGGETLNGTSGQLSARLLAYGYRSPIGAWTRETIEGGSGAPFVGRNCDLVLDDTGAVHIAHFDTGNADLRYATNPAPPLGEWTTGLVDDDGSVGLQPSIQVDEFGTLTVSYYDASNESLKLARRPLGEAWDVGLLTAGTGLATEGQVGLFSALLAEDSANLHVAYYEGLSDDLYYAYRATCEF